MVKELKKKLNGLKSKLGPEKSEINPELDQYIKRYIKDSLKNKFK